MDTDEPVERFTEWTWFYEAVESIPGVPSWTSEPINFVHSRMIILRFGIIRGPSFMLLTN